MTLEELLQKAESGDPQAQFYLGVFCEESAGATERDIKRAFEWYRKAAERGYAPAQNQLGGRYLDGYNVEKDEARAVGWFRKAAEQGYAAAQHNLGFCYFFGRGVDRSAALAVKWYRRAAELGYAEAQNNLAVCYQRGAGTETDAAQAAEWFERAAEQGYAPSQSNLGMCYYRGNGVKQNYAKAAEWFEKAAARQIAQAQYYLGECYYFGNGVERDIERAVSLYRAAAKQGHVTARCRMLGMAAQGLLTDALWIDAAADAGYAEAQILREDRLAAEKEQEERRQAAEQRFHIANAFNRHHVFISWNHHDVAFKDRLVDGIEGYEFQAGASDRIFPHFRTWESDRDGEGEIGQCVKNAIDRSKCFVALLSEHAAESAWMRKEIAYALEKVERGEWREEDLIVVCLDGAADAAAKRADKDDPFVRMSGIAAKFSDASNAERTVASVCGQIKRCLERKTCERFLRESKEECSLYKSTIYGQIPGEEGGLLKSRFSMDGAYMRPALFDAVSGQPVSPQAIMKTPVSFRLIGAGGVGKSLFVRYLIKNYMGDGRIFIKLDLSDGEILSQLSQARSLRELLNAEINRYAEDEAGKSDGAFARLADGGSNRIFIVFDGMDELEEGGREKLARLAEAHFKQYPSHKFIVTSRTQEGIQARKRTTKKEAKTTKRR